MNSWHIMFPDGRTIGPVDTEQVRQEMAAGRVPPGTAACLVGGTQWTPVTIIAEFSTQAASLVPISTASQGPTSVGPTGALPPSGGTGSWYVRRGTAEPEGPLETAVVSQGLSSGQIPRSVQVRAADGTEWVSVAQCEAFASIPPAHTVPPFGPRTPATPDWVPMIVCAVLLTIATGLSRAVYAKVNETRELAVIVDEVRYEYPKRLADCRVSIRWSSRGKYDPSVCDQLYDTRSLPTPADAADVAASSLFYAVVNAAFLAGAIGSAVAQGRRNFRRLADSESAVLVSYIAIGGGVLHGLITAVSAIRAFVCAATFAAGSYTLLASAIAQLVVLAGVVALAVSLGWVIVRIKSGCPEYSAMVRRRNATAKHHERLGFLRTTLSQKNAYLQQLRANAGDPGLVAGVQAEFDRLREELGQMERSVPDAGIRDVLARLAEKRTYVATLIKNCAPPDELNRAQRALEETLDDCRREADALA